MLRKFDKQDAPNLDSRISLTIRSCNALARAVDTELSMMIWGADISGGVAMTCGTTPGLTHSWDSTWNYHN